MAPVWNIGSKNISFFGEMRDKYTAVSKNRYSYIRLGTDVVEIDVNGIHGEVVQSYYDLDGEIIRIDTPIYPDGHGKIIIKV